MIYLRSVDDSTTKECYLRERLGSLAATFSGEEREAFVASVVMASGDAETPHFDPAVEAGDDALSKAQALAADLYPLAAGEQVADEALCRPAVEGVPPEALPLFLRQSTDRAVVFLLVDQPTEDADLVAVSSDADYAEQSMDQDPAGEQDAAAAWALALAKKLGPAILKRAGTFVWGVVKKEALGQTGLPSYYEEVYEELRKIIRAERRDHYLRDVRIATELFEKKIEYYNEFGRKPADFVLLKNTSHELLVKANNLGNDGAFHYSEAATMDIMMMQEDYKRMFERGASREVLDKAKAFISQKAREYADNMTTKRNAVFAHRMTFINDQPYTYYAPRLVAQTGRVVGTVVEGGYATNGERYRSGGPALFPMNKFEDKANPHPISRFGNFWVACTFNIFNPSFSWNFVNDRLKLYRAAMEQITAAELQPVLDVAQALRDIANDPVGGIED